MTDLMKVLTFFGASLLGAIYIFGCAPRHNNWKYACNTPIGQIEINEETDTDIRIKDGVLSATRQADSRSNSIRIPFVQCIALRNNN